MPAGPAARSGPPAEGASQPMSPGLPRPTESLPGVAVGGCPPRCPCTGRPPHPPWAGGWPLFLPGCEGTLLNIWRADLPEKQRPAAQAAWEGRAALPRERGGVGGRRGEGRGWAGASPGYRWATQGVPPGSSSTGTWEPAGNAESGAPPWPPGSESALQQIPWVIFMQIKEALI